MKQILRQLSKRQLGQIRGGQKFECVAFNGDERTIHEVDAENVAEAADMVYQETGAGQVNCTRA